MQVSGGRKQQKPLCTGFPFLIKCVQNHFGWLDISLAICVVHCGACRIPLCACKINHRFDSAFISKRRVHPTFPANMAHRYCMGYILHHISHFCHFIFGSLRIMFNGCLEHLLAAQRNWRGGRNSDIVRLHSNVVAMCSWNSSTEYG